MITSTYKVSRMQSAII